MRMIVKLGLVLALVLVTITLYVQPADAIVPRGRSYNCDDYGYAQRVTAWGVPGWFWGWNPTTGVAWYRDLAGRTIYFQPQKILVPGPNGGFVVVWQNPKQWCERIYGTKGIIK